MGIGASTLTSSRVWVVEDGGLPPHVVTLTCNGHGASIWIDDVCRWKSQAEDVGSECELTFDLGCPLESPFPPSRPPPASPCLAP